MAKSATIPAELNKARHRLALASLDRLLEKAANQHFTGKVAVEVNSKDGRLGQPRLVCERFADPELSE
jgi:uncharacterized protein (DUF2141 family)